ncbi:MAG: hypothetical protein R3C20_07735 [Planctomycetaceae bacterium]
MFKIDHQFGCLDRNCVTGSRIEKMDRDGLVVVDKFGMVLFVAQFNQMTVMWSFLWMIMTMHVDGVGRRGVNSDG